MKISRKTKFTLLTLIFVLGFVEFSARVAWHFRSHVPVFGNSRRNLYLAYYPNLRIDEVLSQTDRKAFFEVLLIGGSVLASSYKCIQAKVNAHFNGKLRVHSIATAAHSTRDSLLKYGFLSKTKYDLVIHYEAINDVRANNVPSEQFSHEYSHYEWYRQVNLLQSKFLTSSEALFSLRLLSNLLWDKISNSVSVPMQMPTNSEWISFGTDIKTHSTFKKNLEEIASIAKEKGEPLLLISFATFLPDHYSEEAFMAKKLGYGPQDLGKGFPIEIWGSKEGVVVGVATHNSVLREISKERPELFFYDLEKAFPKSPELFVDFCHLTQKGCDLFSDRLVEELSKLKQNPRIATRAREVGI